jgi:hypothetical protein
MRTTQSSAPIVGILDADMGRAFSEASFEDTTIRPIMPSATRTKSCTEHIIHEDGWFDGPASVVVSPEPSMPGPGFGVASAKPNSKRPGSHLLNRAQSESRVEDYRKISEAQASSAINDAARIKSWDEVCTKCQNVPLDAAYRDSDGWTALHHAATRRPPARPVEALVLAHPDAIFWAEKVKGMTPLHYACRFKANLDVVELLLKAARMAESDPSIQNFTAEEKMVRACAATCKKGRTPLYYALRYDAPDGVMELLLKHYPLGGIRQDKTGISPLRYVWDQDRKNLAHFQEAAIALCANSKSHEQIVQQLLRHKSKKVSTFSKSFVTAIKLICAAHSALKKYDAKTGCEPLTAESFDADSIPVKDVLHALSNVGACHIPPLIWELATLIFRNQACEKDEDKKLPLHYGLKLCSTCACLHMEEMPATKTQWAEMSISAMNSSNSSSATLGFSASMSSVGFEQPSQTSAANPMATSTGAAIGAGGVSQALTEFTSHDIVLNLLTVYSKGAREKDGDDDDIDSVLPLHLALLSNMELERQGKSTSCKWRPFLWKKEGEASALFSHDIDLEGESEELDELNFLDSSIMEPSASDHMELGTGVIGRLVKHYPDALYEAETCSKLLAFMMPVVEDSYLQSQFTEMQGADDMQSATLAYDLLLECPGILSTFDFLMSLGCRTFFLRTRDFS